MQLNFSVFMILENIGPKFRHHVSGKQIFYSVNHNLSFLTYLINLLVLEILKIDFRLHQNAFFYYSTHESEKIVHQKVRKQILSTHIKYKKIVLGRF